ncbi:CBO0543 family protein [Paenibacillus cremeus]|uniref:Uncharacterized protein n=1 Tax=Paenibacillus cremeus TaxID=2163881 RepID=A0A559K6S8_9BACL|nr:CBO0543 family protein [Paenibacillus cremeus]TVY07848.1 hypothetical protein FPZ49_22090 [Paenibacillus cremeus]
MFWDHVMEAAVWVVSILMQVMFTPREKLREAQIGFLIAQVPTWLLGVIVVQYDLVDYPVHFFDKATQTNFTYEFLALPVVCSLYSLHYPRQAGVLRKMGYSVMFPIVLTVIEVALQKYTNLIRYNHWNSMYSFVSIWFVLHVCHVYIRWFFREPK